MALITSGRGRETPQQGAGWASKREMNSLHARLQNMNSSDGSVRITQGARGIDLRAKAAKTLITIAASDSSAAAKAAADYVCDGTADQEQFYSAIEAVADGGTVYMYDGTYYFSAAVTWFTTTMTAAAMRKEIVIAGETKAGAVIKPSAAAVTFAFYCANSTVDTSAAGKVTFRNFTITDDGSNHFTSAGIRINNSVNRYRLEAHIVDVDVTSISGSGFYIYYVDSVHISGCSVTGCGIGGVQLYGVGNSILTSCTFSTNTVNGCEIGSATQHSRGSHFASHCTFSSNTQSGVKVNEGYFVANQCTASSNGVTGFFSVSQSFSCTASSNTSIGFNGGIHRLATASGNGTDFSSVSLFPNTDSTVRVVTQVTIDGDGHVTDITETDLFFRQGVLFSATVVP